MKTKNTQGELLAKKIFKERYLLEFEKIPESTQQTSDFYIKHGQEILAVAEVKDFSGVFPSDKYDLGYSKNVFGVWSKKDNSADRVSRKIKEGYDQLVSYETKNKVLILVNYALNLDVLDLKATLDGYLIYSSQDGSRIKNFVPYAISHKHIKKKISLFDGIFWIETNQSKIQKYELDLFCFYKSKEFVEKLTAQYLN